MVLSCLYPVIDSSGFAKAADPISAIAGFAGEIILAGATLIQYRDKSGDVPRMLSCARELRRVTQDRATLIINDRLDICLAANADGVHLGQDDISPAAARSIFDSAAVSHPSAPALRNSRLLRGKMGRPRDHRPTSSWRQEIRRAPHPFAERIDATSEILSERVGAPDSLLIGYSTHNVKQVEEADALPADYIAIGPVFATLSKANPDPVIGLEGVRRARAATAKPLIAIGGITRKNCRQVVDAGADAVAVISDLLNSPGKAVEEFLRILE